MQSHYITASRHCITPSHYTTALRHRITPLRHNTRSTRSTAYTLGRRYKPISSPNSSARHPWATLKPRNVPQQFCAAPSGDVTAPKRSPTVLRDTLGQHYSLKVFPNRAARHSRATLQAYIVSQQFCATPSGNTLPLFRRWRVRIEAVLNKPGDSFSTLGRRFKPTSFHNRAMRHSRATLQPLNVPQQGCAAPLGNTLPLFRRRNIRIDPVMNKPGDTFGTAYTLGRRYKPISSHNRAARHSRATLQPQNVPQQFCAAPSGDIKAP